MYPDETKTWIKWFLELFLEMHFLLHTFNSHRLCSIYCIPLQKRSAKLPSKELNIASKCNFHLGPIVLEYLALGPFHHPRLLFSQVSSWVKNDCKGWQVRRLQRSGICNVSGTPRACVPGGIISPRRSVSPVVDEALVSPFILGILRFQILGQWPTCLCQHPLPTLNSLF